MFKKVLSTVLLIVMVFAVSLPCSAAVVTDGEKFYVLGDANGDGTMDIRDLVRVKRYIADNSVEIVNVAADIDGDGKVSMKDWNRVYAHINKTELLTEYALQCGDVNGDGTVNMKDWKRIYDHINKTELLW